MMLPRSKFAPTSALAVKRLRKREYDVKMARKEFLDAMFRPEVTEEAQLRVKELVTTARAAKQAPFLEKYRRARKAA